MDANRDRTGLQSGADGVYLKRLDAIGTSARFPMATSLCRLRPQTEHHHVTVNPIWTTRFLGRRPGSIYEKQKTLDRVASS